MTAISNSVDPSELCDRPAFGPSRPSKDTVHLGPSPAALAMQKSLRQLAGKPDKTAQRKLSQETLPKHSSSQKRAAEDLDDRTIRPAKRRLVYDNGRDENKHGLTNHSPRPNKRIATKDNAGIGVASGDIMGQSNKRKFSQYLSPKIETESADELRATHSLKRRLTMANLQQHEHITGRLGPIASKRSTMYTTVNGLDTNTKFVSQRGPVLAQPVKRSNFWELVNAEQGFKYNSYPLKGGENLGTLDTKPHHVTNLPKRTVSTRHKLSGMSYTLDAPGSAKSAKCVQSQKPNSPPLSSKHRRQYGPDGTKSHPGSSNLANTLHSAPYSNGLDVPNSHRSALDPTSTLRSTQRPYGLDLPVLQPDFSKLAPKSHRAQQPHELDVPKNEFGSFIRTASYSTHQPYGNSYASIPNRPYPAMVIQAQSNRLITPPLMHRPIVDNSNIARSSNAPGAHPRPLPSPAALFDSHNVAAKKSTETNHASTGNNTKHVHPPASQTIRRPQLRVPNQPKAPRFNNVSFEQYAEEILCISPGGSAKRPTRSRITHSSSQDTPAAPLLAGVPEAVASDLFTGFIYLGGHNPLVWPPASCQTIPPVGNVPVGLSPPAHVRGMGQWNIWEEDEDCLSPF